MLLLIANPQDPTALHIVHVQAKRKMTGASRKDARSLNQTYTSNTSLVAILITTITFAAAFTLPGGYSNDVGSEGLPIMSKKFSFQAFLISDLIAISSSFVVAFICIIARWEDYEFLIGYRSFTKKLMWFSCGNNYGFFDWFIHDVGPASPLVGHCNFCFSSFLAHSH